jgi:hypothetical protein
MIVVDIAHMSEQELNEQVLLLANMDQFDVAAKLITAWVDYDFIGRWDDLDKRTEQDNLVQTFTERRVKKEAPMEKAKTIKERMLREFGDLGNG